MMTRDDDKISIDMEHFGYCFCSFDVLHIVMLLMWPWRVTNLSIHREQNDNIVLECLNTSESACQLLGLKVDVNPILR